MGSGRQVRFRAAEPELSTKAQCPKAKGQNCGCQAGIPMHLKQNIARLRLVGAVHLQAVQKLGHHGKGKARMKEAGRATVTPSHDIGMKGVGHGRRFLRLRP